MSERDREDREVAELRAAFAALAGEPPPAAAGPCPEPETLHAGVRGELAPHELRAVVDHIAACPECAEDWRLAMAFEEEAASAAVASAPRRFRLRLLPMAATFVIALLAAGVWFTVGHGGPEEAPVFRAPGDPGEMEIRSLLPRDEALDRTQAVLRWRLGAGGAPAGTTYDLLVSTPDYATVAEARGLEAPRHRIPPEALEGLPAGTELQWQVDARLPGGSRVSSPPFVTPIE